MFKFPPHFNRRKPIQWLACGLGSGLVKFAPGTWGTLVAIPLFFLVSWLPLPVLVIVVTVLSVLGIYICGQAAKDFQVHDHPSIVWDEFAGIWITLLWVPLTWPWVLAAFILFRLLDILKPWPIRYFDRHVHGGLGIMLDDLIAGFVAGFILFCCSVWVA